MKTRESGMPDEERWSDFFDPDFILSELDLDPSTKGVVDMGSGYGTFAIPAALRISGRVLAVDIDPQMVEVCQTKIKEAGLTNISCQQRDFVTYGICLPDESADFVMLFNILHAENPVRLLEEAYRILVPCGKVGVIHWNYDPTTPRGHRCIRRSGVPDGPRRGVALHQCCAHHQGSVSSGAAGQHPLRGGPD